MGRVRSAEGLARERGDKRADVARARAQGLEPKLNRLTIAVAPSIARSGLQVLRDGVPIAPEELGLAMPVDPGPHVVVVLAPGHKMRSFDAKLDAEGQATTIQVDNLDETSTPTPTPTPTPTSTSDIGTARHWIGLGVGGLGIVGVSVGTFFGITAKSKVDESNGGATPPCNASDQCTTQGLSLRKDADTAATGANIAFAVGGVALATGIVLYLTAPRGGSTTGVVVVPAPMTGGGGAMVRGSF